MDTQIMPKKYVLIFVFVILMVVPFAFAQEKNKTLEPEVDIIKVDIHATGIIDRITSDEVLIGDQLFRIAPNASTRVAEDGSHYSGTLKKGMLIGLELNKDHEIVAIWVLKQKL